MTPSPAIKRLGKALSQFNSGERVHYARVAGVKPRLAHRAVATVGRVNVRPFPGDAYVSLCAAISLDPVTGETIQNINEYGPFLWVSLACASKMVRLRDQLSQRAAAKKFKIEPTALCRIENGTPVSVEPLLALCAALGRHPFEFLQDRKFHGEHKVQQIEEKQQSPEKAPA